MLSEVKDEVMILSLEELWSAVVGDENTVRGCRMDCEEEHQRQMISLVCRGAGVDELRIDSVRRALIIWVH
eukprot:843357-Karenia_brevis.AAC.1